MSKGQVKQQDLIPSYVSTRTHMTGENQKFLQLSATTSTLKAKLRLRAEGQEWLRILGFPILIRAP